MADESDPPLKNIYCENLKGTVSQGSWLVYEVRTNDNTVLRRVGIAHGMTDHHHGDLQLFRAEFLSSAPHSFVRRASQLTTPVDKRVIEYNNPVEIYLTSKMDTINPGNVLEYAFVFGPSFLMDNSHLCIAGISNAYLLRFEDALSPRPNFTGEKTLVRLDRTKDDPTADEPIEPFISHAFWDCLADDIPRMHFEFLTKVQEELRAIFRSQSSAQSVLVHKTRTIQAYSINWDFLRRRLFSEDATIEMGVNPIKRIIPTQHYGLTYSKIRVTSEPQRSVLIVTRAQLSAFERVFGTTVTIGVRGPMPSVKAQSRKRLADNDTLNIMNVPEEVPPVDELRNTHRILLTYYRSSLTIYVMYGRLVFQETDTLPDILRIVQRHGVVVSPTPEDDSDVDINVLNTEVAQYSIFRMNGRLYSVDSVEGFTVKATHIDHDIECGPDIRQSEVVARNEEEFNYIREKVHYFYARTTN